jgi:hypothetical protein
MPQLGDFGLVRSFEGPWYDRFFGHVIDWDTDSPYHHAVTYIGDTPDGDIIEAVKRVSYGHADQYDDIVWSTGRLPAALTPTDEQRQLIVQAAIGMLDLHYNVLDILAIGLAQRRFGHAVDGDEWWVKRLSNDNRVICSQAVDLAYLKAGIHLFTDGERGRLPGLVSPADLGSLLLPAA